MSDNIYYVYQYVRTDGTPYYIGKGKGDRAWDKGHNVTVPTDKLRIQMIKENLSEEEAFSLEIDLIALYGRKDLGTGILRNLTDGGEGAGGAIRSEESRKNYSKSKIGKNNPMFGLTGSANPFYGKKHSDELKQKWSLKRKGKLVGELNPMFGVAAPNKGKAWFNDGSKEFYLHKSDPNASSFVRGRLKK
mgnify:FL=1